MKAFTSYSRRKAARSRRYPRPGVLFAAAAVIAAVEIVMSGAGEPGTAPRGSTGTSSPWSPRYSLVGTGWWTPDPAAPQEADPSVAANYIAPPPAAAPRPVAPPAAVPPAPPPQELRLRQDKSSAAAFVSITNNAGRPAVGCVYRAVAVAGAATMIHWDDSVSFTVIGSDEAKIKYRGPATGSTFHDTVTCDNGLSTSADTVW